MALYFIAGNAPVVPLARLAGIPSILQIDGLDSERAKWSGPARAYLRMAERLAPRAATIAVTDSRGRGRRLRAPLRPAHPLRSPTAPSCPTRATRGGAERLGVEPGRFVLFVGRLVPENNAHLLVEAHRRLDADWPLVVVGDAPYAERYIADLQAAAGPDVGSPGYVFGDGYRELVHRCGVMCVPTEVGGTHPVIVEGMAAGAALLVSDHAPNLEVVGDAAATLRPRRRRARAGRGARRADRRPATAARELGRRGGRARAADALRWDACADSYLRLCERPARRVTPVELSRGHRDVPVPGPGAGLPRGPRRRTGRDRAWR